MPVRLKHVLIAPQPVTADMPARSAFNLFSSDPDLPALVVLQENAPIGIVTRTRLAETLAGPSGDSILAMRKVANVMETDFVIAEASLPVAAIAKQAAETHPRALVDGVVILNAGEYAGFVSPAILLKTVAEENTARARAMQKFKAQRQSSEVEIVQLEPTKETETPSQFLAMLSHEIRTPLSGILGVADLLVDAGLPEEPRRYAKTIASSGRLLDRLLTDVLDLSRMEAGKLPLNPEPLSLRNFANEARDLWATKTIDQNVALRISLARGSEKRVVADAMRLKQVLFNLMSNALKFTEKGFVDVELATRETGSGDLTLVMTVSDTGCGIADEHKERLFREFEQASEKTASIYGGAGLGLSIAKGLVELMGGTISLSDNPAGGSVFVVEVGVDRAGPRLAVENAARPRRGRLELGEILIIEDHRVSQMVMEKALTAAGWQVDCVFTGDQGVRRALGKAYQAILIDRYLPDATGDEILARIRAEGMGKATPPVLEVTADVSPERRDASAAAGFDGFIAKPIRPRELVAALADVVMMQQSTPTVHRAFGH